MYVCVHHVETKPTRVSSALPFFFSFAAASELVLLLLALGEEKGGGIRFLFECDVTGCGL